MTVQVTLTLPDDLVEQAKWFSSATKQNVETVLADALEMMWPTLGKLPEKSYPDIENLSDQEVLALADSKMDAIQNKRLGTLQAKGKQIDLTFAESYELSSLMQIYQLGLLRKSEALAEAVKRGLREPLQP